MENSKIIVDIEDAIDVSKKIDFILANLDELCENARENGGIMYGKYQEENFIEYEIDLHKDMPSYSELVFFLSAVNNSDNINKIRIFVKDIMQRNKVKKIWLDEEMPMALNASFALAYTEKKYISEFIDFLRTCDMNHEVYQFVFICLLEKKWQVCDEILELLAARTNSISGQWGLEFHDTLNLSDEQKKHYLNSLLKDTLFSKIVYPNMLIDGCNKLGISVDNNKFNSFFINRGAFSNPTFVMSEIPSLVEQMTFL